MKGLTDRQAQVLETVIANPTISLRDLRAPGRTCHNGPYDTIKQLMAKGYLTKPVPGSHVLRPTQKAISLHRANAVIATRLSTGELRPRSEL